MLGEAFVHQNIGICILEMNSKLTLILRIERAIAEKFVFIQKLAIFMSKITIELTPSQKYKLYTRSSIKTLNYADCCAILQAPTFSLQVQFNKIKASRT